MRQKNLKVFLLSFLFLFALSACNDDSKGSGGSSEPETATPAVESEHANLALFGDIDPNKTTEAGESQPSLLLDDEDIDYSAFGMQFVNVQEPAVAQAEGDATPTSDAVDEKLQLVRSALEEQGASVNELVNRNISGIQAAVSLIVLDVEFAGSAYTSSAIRNLLLDQFGSDANVAVLPSGGAAGREFRVSMAFWQLDDQLFTWLAVFASSFAEQVTRTYGDVNNGSAVMTAGTAANLVDNTQSFSQNEEASNAADILWVIDNSGSMSEEQQNLGSGVDQFFDSLITAGVDFHLGATTTDSGYCTTLTELPDGSGDRFISPATVNGKAMWSHEAEGEAPSGIARPGANGSGSETGFFCADQVALGDFDRETAPNIAVFVSDEPENESVYEVKPHGADSSYVARNFNTYKQVFTASGTTFFAIVGPSEQTRDTFESPMPSGEGYDCVGDGGSASGGAHYRDIALSTGGSASSICASADSWNVMFEQVIQAATGLASSFQLDFVPLASTVEVSVDGVAVPRDVGHSNGFDVLYSNQGAALVFYGDALPQAGDEISVTYQSLPPAP